jgi:hypothetical protein
METEPKVTMDGYRQLGTIHGSVASAGVEPGTESSWFEIEVSDPLGYLSRLRVPCTYDIAVRAGKHIGTTVVLPLMVAVPVIVDAPHAPPIESEVAL